MCLFVDSACLLASASHMNIFPNVTRPQLRAKNQHHSDEATSSSLPVRWPAVQRRRRDSTGRRRRVYCILHACLRIVVISRIKLSCLMPFCPLPPPPWPHCTVRARLASPPPCFEFMPYVCLTGIIITTAMRTSSPFKMCQILTLCSCQDKL